MINELQVGTQPKNNSSSVKIHILNTKIPWRISMAVCIETNKHTPVGGYTRHMNSNETVQAYTIRLELVDEPGELMRALEPIANNGGNLLSIYHKRGNTTPRGYIPVEIDMEATPERFGVIVENLRGAGVKVVQAGTERYSENITVILSGHLVDTDLSDTLTRIREDSDTSIKALSLSAPDGTQDVSSARLEVATAERKVGETMDVIRRVASKKDLKIIEPVSQVGDV